MALKASDRTKVDPNATGSCSPLRRFLSTSGALTVISPFGPSSISECGSRFRRAWGKSNADEAGPRRERPARVNEVGCVGAPGPVAREAKLRSGARGPKKKPPGWGGSEVVTGRRQTEWTGTTRHPEVWMTLVINWKPYETLNAACNPARPVRFWAA